MDSNFDLFSSAENAGKSGRIVTLRETQIQVMRKRPTKSHYIRLNKPLAKLLSEKEFDTLVPIFNNITGEIYLVFRPAAAGDGYPLDYNGGKFRNYAFSRPLVEWLVGNTGRNLDEDFSEIWTISGDVSINPRFVAVRIEKH